MVLERDFEFSRVWDKTMKTRKVSFAQSASKPGSSNKGATCDAMMGSASRDETAEFGVLLLSVQEGIQQRLASDLHDSTCQHLIAVSLNIMRMRRAMNDLGSVERICDAIDASIEQALREIRAFTYLLHPQNLLADGLKTTVEQFVAGFSARTSLKASVNIGPEVDRLSYEAQRSVLRVIQEALTNVFRHAKATQVKIAIEATDTHLKLWISDNGCGMPIRSARAGLKATSFGVGIPAMRTRLQQIGGSLEIHSSSPTECPGTTLCAAIPRFPPRKRARPSERLYTHYDSVPRQHTAGEQGETGNNCQPQMRL
jgi:two-component system NarL family sensor kinase